LVFVSCLSRQANSGETPRVLPAPGGVPSGIYLEEMDDEYLTEMITPGRPGKVSDLELFGRWAPTPLDAHIAALSRLRVVGRRLWPTDSNDYLI
jgi:hypothetical protein